MKPTTSGIRVELPNPVKPGLIANPINVITGKTSHPLNRSKTTEVKLIGPSSVSFVNRLTLTTSPPTVVGRKLETNCPDI